MKDHKCTTEKKRLFFFYYTGINIAGSEEGETNGKQTKKKEG